MSEEEAEGSIQVEDTSEKENIEPPLKKAKLREDKHIDRLGKLEARLSDILSCTVCLDLPSKSVFQVFLFAVCFNRYLLIPVFMVMFRKGLTPVNSLARLNANTCLWTSSYVTFSIRFLFPSFSLYSLSGFQLLFFF